MVSGYNSVSGVEDLVKTDGIMNTQKYYKILIYHVMVGRRHQFGNSLTFWE